jgi:hypothetical protein
MNTKKILEKIKELEEHIIKLKLENQRIEELEKKIEKLIMYIYGYFYTAFCSVKVTVDLKLVGLVEFD